MSIGRIVEVRHPGANNRLMSELPEPARHQALAQIRAAVAELSAPLERERHERAMAELDAAVKRLKAALDRELASPGSPPNDEP